MLYPGGTPRDDSVQIGWGTTQMTGTLLKNKGGEIPQPGRNLEQRESREVTHRWAKVSEVRRGAPPGNRLPTGSPKSQCRAVKTVSGTGRGQTNGPKERKSLAWQCEHLRGAHIEAIHTEGNP